MLGRLMRDVERADGRRVGSAEGLDPAFQVGSFVAQNGARDKARPPPGFLQLTEDQRSVGFLDRLQRQHVQIPMFQIDGQLFAVLIDR